MVGARTKQYKIDFYVVTSDRNRENNALKDLLDTGTNSPAMPLNLGETEHFQIKSVVPSANGFAYKGVFGRVRFNETPEQGHADGSEDDVELKPGYGLVEKNYFIFYPSNNLLIYQRNASGSHYSKLQRYVQLATGANVGLEPILKRDSYEVLLSGTTPVKSIDVSFQKPRDPSLYPQQWTRDALNLLDTSGGLNARMTIGVGRSDQRMMADIKQAVVTLAQAGLAKVARVKLEDVSDPIDLIADRVIETVHVDLQDNGRPKPEYVYAAIEGARTRRSTDLDSFFGTHSDPP